jgi:4-hydroxybenzoate polyprenyltransferase
VIPSSISLVVRALRPQQWLTNLVVFAALLFSYHLLDPWRLARAGAGFVLLCGLSGATFLVNDILDRDRDREHPTRSIRPIASGALSVRAAGALALVLSLGCLVGAFFLEPAFALAATCYLALMSGYSLGLRRQPILDILAIGSGLVLRAVAGALLVQARISPWLLLGVGGVGLMLALGRIEQEMRLAAAAGRLDTTKYTPQVVTRLDAITISVTVIVYCLYTFLAARLPGNHAMMLTIPIVLYGVFRYRLLSFGQEAVDDFEVRLLSDRPLRAAALLWLVAVGAVLYLWGP